MGVPFAALELVAVLDSLEGIRLAPGAVGIFGQVEPAVPIRMSKNVGNCCQSTPSTDFGNPFFGLSPEFGEYDYEGAGYYQSPPLNRLKLALLGQKCIN